jgi:branched-chain amino acid transport system permease protein
MTKVLQYIVDGMAQGSLYVMISLGFTLVFGVMGIMNVAHADMFMVGVFVMLLVASSWHLGIVLGSLAGIVIVGVLGFALFHLVLKRVDREQQLALFIATLGVSYFLENFIAKRVEFRTRSVPALFKGHYFQVGGVRFSNAQIVLLLMTLIVAFGLITWLQRSEPGRLLRAVSENPQLAEILAIPTRKLMALAAVIGSVIAAIGGLLVSNTTLSIDPFVANTISLKMFAVAVVAGVGSVEGAVVVGLGLGVVESLAVGFIPNGSAWQNVVGLVAMVVILLVRPQGLFGRSVRVG